MVRAVGRDQFLVNQPDGAARADLRQPGAEGIFDLLDDRVWQMFLGRRGVESLSQGKAVGYGLRPVIQRLPGRQYAPVTQVLRPDDGLIIEVVLHRLDPSGSGITKHRYLMAGSQHSPMRRGAERL